MATDNGARRVLLVEPDNKFGRLLSSYLQGRGWAVQWVEDGRAALASWERFAPDLVVTELQGRELDGFEFINEVVGLPGRPPVVVCTRLVGAGQWDAAEVRGLGVEAVMVRPLRLMELEGVLERALDRRA